MMKSAKRVLCSLLVIFMLISLLTGCGGNQPAGTASSTSSSPQATTGDNTSAAKPKLKILTWYAPNVDINNDVVYHDVVKRTGYEVEYFMLPADNPDEKLNLEISSGTTYDILKLNPGQYTRLLSQGIYAELDGVLATHGKNILNAISKESFDIIRSNGKTYGIPQITERPNLDYCLAIRQDLLDSLSLSMPKNLEEFYNVLKTIKEKKPDMIPYTLAGSPFDPVILSAFGISDGWPQVNGEITWNGKLPQMKEYLAFMKKLYDEGLLDQDFAMNKQDTVLAKFTGGKAAVMPYGWLRAVGTPEALNQNVPEGKISLVFPLADANGVAKIPAAGYGLNNVSGVMKKSPNLEHAISFMDAKLAPENFTFLALGEEGKTFTKEGTTYRPIMPALTEQRGNAWVYLNGFDEKLYPDMWLARIWRDPNLGKAFEMLNAEFDKYSLKPALAYLPSLPADGKYMQSLDTLVKDTFTQFILGAKPLDQYDEFLKQWDGQGGLEVTKGRNEWKKSMSK